MTDDVKKMRGCAFGAGTAGVWLRIGSAILSFAIGLAARLYLDHRPTAALILPPSRFVAGLILLVTEQPADVAVCVPCKGA